MLRRAEQRPVVPESEFPPEVVYNPIYRLDVARRIVDAVQAEEVVIFDDVVHAVEPSQRHFLHGLPGYERCLLPAIPFSVERKTTVIMQMPPLPQEMNLIGQLLETVSSGHNYQVLVPCHDEWKDAYTIYRNSEREYQDLVTNSRHHLPEDDPDFHLRAATRLLDARIIGRKRTLVLPFETRRLHLEALSEWIDTGQIILPHPADWLANKGLAHTYYQQAGLDRHLPSFVWVQVPPEHQERTVSNESLLVDQIFRAVARIEDQGKTTYIKTNSAGVSGVGNLSPNRYPDIYDLTASPESRKAALNEALFGREGKLAQSQRLPTGALIEELIPIAIDSLDRREWTVSGFTISGVFHPWGCTRTQNTDSDIYVGAIASANPELIGLSQVEFLEKIKIVAVFAKAGLTHGYGYGYTAKDVIDSVDGRSIIHDHNDRRGGRSAVEILVAFTGYTCFLDRDYEFPIPDGAIPLDVALRIAEALVQDGSYPYGTNTTAFPTETDRGQSIKFKVLAPLETDEPVNEQQLIRVAQRVQEIGETCV